MRAETAANRLETALWGASPGRPESVALISLGLAALARIGGGAQPGITVAQAAAVIGVDATALYPVIRRLEPRGDLVKRGRELHPAEVG